MRALILHCSMAMLLTLSACDLFGGSSDGGGGGSVDLAAPPVADLATSPGADLVAPPAADLATPRTPDLARADAGAALLTLRWQLYTAQLKGGTNNGYLLACDAADAMITTLVFTAQNPATTKSVVTEVPCPPKTDQGETTINLPDATGPFTIWAVGKNKSTSVSERVRNVDPDDYITVRIYAGGCDSTACQP